MLPSRGRGRGNPSRGRGRGRDVGIPQQSHDSDEASKASRPCSSGRGRGLTARSKTTLGERASENSGCDNGLQGRARRIERNVNPEELGLQFKRKISITPTPGLPSRPGEGTLGKRIKLISNCFPLKMPSGNVYHYDVSIIEKRRNSETEDRRTALLPAGASKDEKKYRCLSTKKNREIIALMLGTNPVFEGLLAAYDGQKNLYTRNPLQADFPFKCEVILPDENPRNAEEPQANPQQSIFDVHVKPVHKMDTSSCAINLDSLHAFYEKRISSVPQEAIAALETVLRHGPCLRFTPIGRSFFYPPGAQELHPLGGGLDIWFGYHQSLRLGQWGPMVNLDLSATTFYQRGPVIQYIADCMDTTVGDLRRTPFLPNLLIKRLSNKLKDLRIEVNHLRNYRRKYRILRLVKENANRLEFDLEENGRTVKKTVAAYFRERYNRNLEYPNMPCLQVHPATKKTFLPIEVCEIVGGQHCKKTLETKQRAEMIKFTALPPSERFSEIRGIASRADINADRFVHEFDIEVSQNPQTLVGRVLDPPSLTFKDNEIVKPKDGSWSMRHTKFLRGAEINSWVLLSFAKISKHGLDRFSELLIETARNLGITINNPQLISIIDPSRCDIKTVLTDMKTVHKASLAVIVLPTNEKAVYGKIKHAAETSVGLATQCIKEGNVTNPRRCSPQLVSNLCLKINAKMGGENSSLLRCEIPEVLRKPVIIIGADVNHPGASRGIKPTLAACVGSLDSRFSKFAVSLRAQPNIDENKKAIELIVNLKDMVLELLRAFYRHTKNKKPEKIIFYRDGVSEGQFDQVQNKEVRAVREACLALGEDYKPGITFIIVQKRHHVRFIPEDPRDGLGAMKNIPPGTTVDTVVTHPKNFDYFLCSHFGLKGTSRPSHYTVLEDDNDFSADDVQKLTYQLCHTYARCTRSISIPVPVAYADLAAYRARLHLESALEESTSSSDSSAGSNEGPAVLSRSVIDAIKVIPGLSNAMYFV